MLYVIGKPFTSIIIIVPILFVGTFVPVQPTSLSLNSVGCGNEIGIKI